MNASGNRVVTDNTNTSGNRSINSSRFPNGLLMEGPCHMRVTTYAFYIYAKSVKQYEEIFKQLNSNKHGQECGYQFVMCRAEVDESGQVKVLGMVQFEKEPFVIDEIVQYKNVLKRLLDVDGGIPFFREIQDCNVNAIYGWLTGVGTGRIFKYGVFVGSWHIDDCIHSDEYEDEDEYEDMYPVFCI